MQGEIKRLNGDNRDLRLKLEKEFEGRERAVKRVEEDHRNKFEHLKQLVE